MTRAPLSSPWTARIMAGLLLIAAAVIVYGPAVSFPYVSYDDGEYVYNNPAVQEGLSQGGVHWAFSALRASNWHPLTWLAHMLDVSLFGTKAPGHHASNLTLHLLNTLLLLAVMVRLGGGLWQSAWVAGVFAVHPLNVESVVWISEKKNLLCTLFWLLALFSYARYVSRPCRRRYWWVLLWFLGGLLSKPMVVTLPFVLLLLDYWPLGRLHIDLRADGAGATGVGRLVMEKGPLFLMAAGASAMTWAAQHHGGATMPLTLYAMADRLANAVAGYGRYIGKMVVPVDLAVFYPIGPVHLWELLATGSVLAGITALALRMGSLKPYLCVGWFWFLGTLVPVIGLVQVGCQAMADRYMYIPMIGLLIVVAWGAPDLLARFRMPAARLNVPAVALLLVLAALGRQQVGYWQDSTTLFEHAAAVTDGNHIAYEALGSLYGQKGAYDRSIAFLEKSLAIYPHSPKGHYALGLSLEQTGRLAAAWHHFETSMAYDPGQTDTLRHGASVLLRMGRFKEAGAYAMALLDTTPEDETARMILAAALEKLGKPRDAMAQLRRVVAVHRENVAAMGALGRLHLAAGEYRQARLTLAPALEKDPTDGGLWLMDASAAMGLGDWDAAAAGFRRRLTLRPDDARAHFLLAKSLLAMHGNDPEAEGHLRMALSLDPELTDACRELAVLLDRCGRRGEGLTAPWRGGRGAAGPAGSAVTNGGGEGLERNSPMAAAKRPSP